MHGIRRGCLMAIEDLVNAANEYDKEDLSLSLSSAIKKSPDQSAKAYNLAKEKSLPFDYVERNIDKVSAPDAESIRPNVAQILRDREKSAVVHDDIPNLNWWETSAQELGNIGKTALSGAYATSAAGYSVLGSTANAFSAVSLAPSRLLNLATEEELQSSGADIYGTAGKYLLGLAAGERAKAESVFPKKSVINTAVLGGIKSVVMNVPAMAAGVISRSPSVALSGLTASVYGDSYLTAKQAGLNETDSVLYASNQALAERVTEGIPVGQLFKDLGEKSGFFKTIAMQMATEIPTEQVATVWQNAIDWAVLNPDKTLAEFKSEMPGAAVDTLISTIVATGIQAGAIHGLNNLGRKKEDEQVQAIANNAISSKVNSRTPDIFTQHVQDVADQYGAPTEVYIDAKDARVLFQGMQKDDAYDIIASQINQAEELGGDIVIPIGEFASKVATSKNFEMLKSIVRLSPDSPTNSQISSHSEQITNLLAEAAKNVEIKTRADQIYKEISKQLINSGRMNADTAKVNAALVPAYVTVKAARANMSVDDVYAMMGISIEGQGLDQKQEGVLAQQEAMNKKISDGIYEHGYIQYDKTSDDIYNDEGDITGEDKYILIGKVFVDPDYRKKGFARQMMIETLKDIKSKSDLPVRLAALPLNNSIDGQDLVSFYESLGFDVTNTEGSAVVMEWDGIIPKETTKPLAQSAVEVKPAENKNLFVAHNLSAENILAAAKLGGLAAPSLAVARSDIGFDNFGEVTLIADPSILEDKKARTFDADVYSPRQPRSIYDIDAKKYRELINQISEDANTAGGLRIPDAERLSDGANELLRSEALQYHWLKTQGMEPKIIKKKVPADLKGFVAYATKNNIKSDYNLQEDEGFKKLAEAQIKKVSDEIVAQGMDSPYYYDDGTINYQFVQKLASKTIREINSKGVDKVATQDAISKKMRNKSIRVKYEEYATNVFNNLKTGEKLFKGFTDSGNRKYAPYTMENVVKEMTTTLQGGEKSFYGAGSVRSKFANELNTLKKIQQNRNKIISEADFEKVKEQSNKVFLKAMDDLKPYYKFDADSWGYMDDAGSAIIEGPKGIKDTFKSDPEVYKIINDLKEYLSALPTHYFESKMQRAVGFNEFNTAIVPKDLDKNALKVLEDSGLKIKKYDPSKPNARNEKIAEQKGLLFQEQSRGSFDPKTNIIKLGQASDLSTFAHELGHMFLEMEGRLYNHPNVTPEMKADGKVILDWLDIESFDRLKEFETDDKVREAHEKFARGFEKYLAEGKAPSIELKAVFRRFAAWMKQVYRDLRNLNVELNDNVRAVMDRMLATDEQINRTKNVFDPLFANAKEAGMTEPEFKAYTMESSPDSAKEVLLTKMLKQLKREYTKWWKDESLVIAEQVRKEVAKQPLYSALDSMRADDSKLNRADVETHFNGQIPAKFKTLISDAGMSADELAAIHGLASGSDLIDQINTEPTLNNKVKELTQTEMIKRHGDILNDGTIEEEAAQAIRNPEHAKKLMAELNALSRKTKQPTIDREAIKAYAKQTIGAMAYSKIRPAQYRAAEVRAAREAAVAKNNGDLVAAQTAKQQEIINFYLSREATAVKEKAEANRKYLQATQVKKFNPKDVNPDYIVQIQAVASLYEFRKNPENQDRARSRLQSIAAWIEAQETKEQEGFYPVIIDSILSDINSASKNGLLETIDIPSYKEMTGDQIQAISEQVRNLRYIGGKLSENSKEILKAEAKKVGDSIRAHANGIVTVPEEITKRDKTLSALREFGEDHVRMANQIEELDGYKEFGPLFEGFYQDIIDSTNKELKLKRETFDDVVSALSGLTANDVAPGKGEITINYNEEVEGAQPIKHSLTLSRRARIVFGLYWGSPEGREAIRLGHHMTDEQAQLMLDTLDDKDIQAIEGIWKANEKHWPEISRINQKLKGVTLPKVEHVPYSINGRQLAGGYFRLYYQYSQKDSVREIKAEDLLMTRTGNRLSKQTKNGSRNERVGSGGRKVSWEFNNIFLALDETIHDIAFAETASKASRFIRTPEVSTAIMDTYGKEKYDSMVGSLSAVISGNTAMSHPISGFLQHFRVAQTYSMLGYSIRNFVQQPVAFTNVLGKAVTSFDGFGEIKVMKEAVNFAMSPKEFMEFVDSKSEFMINRTSIVNRDTADIRNKLSAGSMAGGAWAKFKDHAFDIQTVGDASVAYPAWKSAYVEGLKKFADEKKAITFADEFVSSTVGSGLIKDLSPLLQGGGKIGQAIGSEQLKGITFMGSFFNITHNLMRESYKKSNKLEIFGVKAIPTEANFYRQTMWYLTVPALLGAWITGDGPDDDESILAWAAKNVAAYGLATVFFVRDIVSVARGFGPSSSYTRALDAASKLVKESVKIAEDEKDVDLKTAAKITRATGMLFPVPGAGQAARTMEYLGSDEDFNPYKALVTGVER